MLIRAAALNKDIGLYSEFSGIVVDGFNTDVEEVDVFVREWRGDINALCIDSRRVLHASRLRVRLTDSSDTKDSVNQDELGLRTRLGPFNFNGYKPSFTDFASNHAAYVPSENCLPRSYQVWRRSIDAQSIRKSIFDRPRAAR